MGGTPSNALVWRLWGFVHGKSIDNPSVIILFWGLNILFVERLRQLDRDGVCPKPRCLVSDDPKTDEARWKDLMTWLLCGFNQEECKVFFFTELAPRRIQSISCNVRLSVYVLSVPSMIVLL